MSAVRLWAVNGVADGTLDGEARHEPLVSTGHLTVTIPAGGALTVYFKDSRGNLKPFPQAALAVVVHDATGALKWGGLTKDYFKVVGVPGATGTLNYVALGV